MAKIPPPRRVQADRLLNDVQSAIDLPLRQVLDFEELTGRPMTATLTTTATPFQHGLGRTPKGWRVTDKTASGDPYRTAWDERTITLRVASGTMTVNIWIW